MPVYPGALPGTLDSQANWRLETRIHGFTSSLATGMSVLAQLGGFRLYLYRFNSQPSYTYAVYINSAAVFLDSTYTDIFIRAQRIGTNYTVKVWKVAADGTMIDAGSSSGGWPGYSLAPEISVGANTDTDVGIFGGRFPFNGSQSFFRFFTANADDSVTPNACDTSAAYIRYEFEGTLANTGNGSASLAPTGTIGYQLAGHGYTGVDGTRMEGISLLDVDTIAGPTRLIGDLVIEVELDGRRQTVVGFENHAGRTRLGPAAKPLGRVISGNGNNGEDHGEGAIQGRVVGTYLHGPLLPKNPWLADRLLGWAFEHATGAPPELAPLDDTLEANAHAAAIARARKPRR